MNRRKFLISASLTSLGLASNVLSAPNESGRKRKFKLCLNPGMIGVSGDPHQIIRWAHEFGFEAVEPPTSFLAKASDADLKSYLDELKQNGLSLGAADLPVEFRKTDDAFESSMKRLPDYAKSLQRAGVTRVATWLMPGDSALTYRANFRQHARRLRDVASVLGDHGIALGLEYVGTKTVRVKSRFEFIHTMAEMKELIAEIGKPNVGFLLDSWHWYTAQETAADILTLRPSDVVMCHLNDAPKDVPLDQQIDGRRELPAATGVIDAKGFLGALIQIGYDGPVACEPFSRELRSMPPEKAIGVVAEAVKKAVSQAESA